jgi:hypothetical protein
MMRCITARSTCGWNVCVFWSRRGQRRGVSVGGRGEEETNNVAGSSQEMGWGGGSMVQFRMGETEMDRDSQVCQGLRGCP